VNIDKVNATLGKALIHIQEGEAEDFHKILMAEEDGDDGDFVTEYFGGLVDQVVEAAGLDHETAFDAVMGAVGDLVDQTPATIQTEGDLDAWAEHVGLAEAIAQRLN